jgi:magnesium transporter
MVRRVPTADPGERVASIRARLTGRRWDVVEDLYLVDRTGRLVGVVPFADLYASEADRPITSLGAARVAVHPHSDQEEVAVLALRHGVTGVPVVDEEQRLLGVVPALALIDILHREHVEDLHRLAGIARERAFVRASVESPPLRRARNRLPWLLVGVLGSALATAVMAGFERTLTEKIAISFFVPAIVYLADAVGTQTETIAVRGLSLSGVSLRRMLAAEVGSGLIIGSALGAIVMLLAWAGFRDLRLALAVGTAVMAACAVATTIGILLPWGLHRLGSDPAFGSGPLATAIQDVLSLLVYFAVVHLVVP